MRYLVVAMWSITTLFLTSAFAISGDYLYLVGAIAALLNVFLWTVILDAR